MVGPAGGRMGSDPSEQQYDHSPSAPQETKRNSAIRKQQNKNASRTYRERRKQKLALLEQLLEGGDSQALPGKSSQEESDPIAPSVSHRQESNSQAISDPGDSTVPGGVSAESTASPGLLNRSIGTAEVAPSALGDFSFDSPWPVPFGFNDPVWHLAMMRQATSSSAAPSISEPLGLASGLSSVFGHGTGILGSDGSSGGPRPRAATSATTLGQTRPLLESQGQSSAHLLQSPSTPQDRNKAKELAEALSQRQQGEGLGPFMDHLMSLRVPAISRVIYVKQNGLFAATLDNTLALGLTNRQSYFDDDGTSPFNRDWMESKGSIRLSDVRSKFAGTPRDLQPVDIQITVKHHIYLDVIPFPSFRERALEALARETPLLDEEELCYDITNREGLVVWGSQGNDQGMDACRPWDMRSWEPSPWFLRKYHFLTGGWDDEMWKAARWWHSMRNERILGPVPSAAPS
ncbi:hypothetical protein VPNG_01946 [Cytospora leucostoma]|uniref:BZIP domain-containing protein n=1 Tax=Cytospora leucostoma TaxID=1230097 RepID=A0A423XIB6_9PEZI|nr:hypothetical protein VPNG_01946 [Cytospora leucostoma]